MKHCEEYSELISAFIDNEISDAEAESLKAHLATCRDCRAYLIYLEKIHTEAAALAVDVPDGFSARVMNSIAASEKAQKRFALSRFKFTAIAAAIILLVFAAGRLDSFFPSVAEDLSNETDESITHDTSPKSNELVPSTLTPLYTAEKEAEISSDDAVEKNTENTRAAPSENKKEAQVEIKNEPVTERSEAAKPESTQSDNTAVEKAENTVTGAPEQADNSAVSDSAVSEDALPPAQNIRQDNNVAMSGGGGGGSSSGGGSMAAGTSPSAGAGSAAEESDTSSDAGAPSENGTAQEDVHDAVTEGDSSSQARPEDNEAAPSTPAMPAVPQSESYSFYISVKGQGALSLFSEYSSNIYEGNYLISIDKANLTSTLSLLESSGFSYYRYEGDGASTNFLLIIIP